jgi:hypothetical protein
VTIPYALNPISDTTATIQVMIYSFNNPISTRPKGGFQVTTFDSNSNVVGSRSDVALGGITQPASLSSTTLQLLDVSMVQEYSTLQLKLSFDVPIDRTCWVKIYFPSDFIIDDKLTFLSGNGIFQT